MLCQHRALMHEKGERETNMTIEFKELKKIVKNSLRGITTDDDGTKHRCKRDLKSTLERLQRLEEKVRTDVRGIELEKPLFDKRKNSQSDSQILRHKYIFRKNIENVHFWHKQELRCRTNSELK